MESTPLPNDPSAYLQNLMEVGDQSIKQFDDAVAAAMGVANGEPTNGKGFSPVAFMADMQRDYFTQVWRFWNAAFVRALTFGADARVQPARSDKRFKDEAWAETP